MQFDTSGSISFAELDQMKAAAKGFVDALQGTPSQVAVYRFAVDATRELPFTSVQTASGADTVRNAIDAVSKPRVLTNWDAAFQVLKNDGADVVVILTDGRPTVYGFPTPHDTTPKVTIDRVNAAIASANEVKSNGARIVAVGIGLAPEAQGITEAQMIDNLKRISGPTLGSDYFLGQFSDLGDIFHKIATALCGSPVIKIVKGGPDLAHVGDTVTYTFSVTNPGKLPLSNVTVTDPRCASAPTFLSGDVNTDKILSGTEVWKFECSHTITAADGDPVLNTATATGVNAGRKVSDQDSHSIDVIHPNISLVKTANPVSGPPGTPVTYTYVVKNTGDTTLLNVKVDDDILGHIGDIASLDPGKTATLTKDSTIPNKAGATTNVGTAVGHDRLNKEVTAKSTAVVTAVLAVPPTHLPKTGSYDPRMLAYAGFALVALGALMSAFGRDRRSPAFSSTGTGVSATRPRQRWISFRLPRSRAVPRPPPRAGPP